jgi:glycerol-3-phosphate dehydrogenase (NAD(P)+)
LGAIARIGVLGAGAWGTALALTAWRAGREAIVWARRPALAAAISLDHENKSALAGIALPPGLTATTALAAALTADAVLICVPAQAVRSVLAAAAKDWPTRTPVVICAKGIELGSGFRMSEVARQTLGSDVPLAVLSGPSFAAEVARELPTAVTLACADAGLRRELPAAIGTPRFRIYSTDDVIGAELGGAIKNVLAIACGIVAGRGLGDNARAALITRGLAEMARLAVALGAKPATLTGLSGLGDLVLTCSALQSRNFSLGVALGHGARLADALKGRQGVTEGVFTAAAVVELAERYRVSMPIAGAVDAVLNQGADLDQTVASLLARPFRDEDALPDPVDRGVR